MQVVCVAIGHALVSSESENINAVEALNTDFRSNIDIVKLSTLPHIYYYSHDDLHAYVHIST